MTEITEEATITRDLPGIWEAFRAISGIAAVLVLAALMLGTALLEDSRPAVLTAAIESPTEGDAAGIPPTEGKPQPITYLITPSTDVFFVFYLVQTSGEADSAEWIEAVGPTELQLVNSSWPDRRRYRVLYARDDEEERLAGRIILDQMMQHDATALIHVVDLRGTTEALR